MLGLFATIWAGAMMLDHLGEAKAAAAITRAAERITAEGPHTPDMGGKASTSDVGAAIAEEVRQSGRIATYSA